jgi:LacI family transcriptional regulator
MRKIAHELGVSQTTVSFVLNDSQHPASRISAATRRKIKEAATRAGYIQNDCARRLATGGASELAFITMEPEIEYVSGILTGLLEETGRQGYHVRLVSVGESLNFTAAVRKCIGQRPAGIISRSFPTPLLEELFNLARGYGIPIAVVDHNTVFRKGLRIRSDVRHGARLAMDHLRSLGHRRIAHATLCPLDGYRAARWEAFREAAQAAGLDSGTLVTGGTPEQLETQIQAVLADRLNAPTGIMCASDLIAMLVLRAARKSGLSIPLDLSVIGTGNLLMSTYADPPLTTLEQRFILMGQTAARLLIEHIQARDTQSPQSARLVTLDMHLVARQSTGPAPSGPDGRPPLPVSASGKQHPGSFPSSGKQAES